MQLDLTIKNDATLYLHGTINGQPVEMLVDSGATACFVGAETAAALGLKPSATRYRLGGKDASPAMTPRWL